jgi:hypothetical protein
MDRVQPQLFFFAKIRGAMKLTLFILLLFTPAFARAGNLEIRDPAVVADLAEVQNEIEAISSAVMSCIDSGREHQECMCDNRGKFVHFSRTVATLFADHPQLEGRDLVHFKGKDGTLVNQSLEGIKRQAGMKLSCPE